MEISRIDQRISLLVLFTSALLFAGCSASQGYNSYADLSTSESTSLKPVSDTDVVPESASDTEPPAVDSNATTASSDTEQSPASETDNTQSGDVRTVGADSNDAGPVEPAVSENEATVGTGSPADTNVADAADTVITQPGPPIDPTADTQPAEPREIKLLIEYKQFRKEGDSDALRLTYDDFDLLKVLNMEPVPVDAANHFPGWLKNLDGKRIRLRGFMYPTFVATGLTRFGLARDNGICCFVKEPKIYDLLEVTMAEGETTDYIDNKPFDVEGVFRIDPLADENELYQLYRIEDAVVLK